MCHECWARYTPQPLTPGVACAVRAVSELYHENPVGGALHVYVDDWNLPVPVERPVSAVDPERALTATEDACWRALVVLTEDEQATALALAQGYYRVGVTT